jgi:hypothetical protein
LRLLIFCFNSFKILVISPIFSSCNAWSIRSLIWSIIEYHSEAGIVFCSCSSARFISLSIPSITPAFRPTKILNKMKYEFQELAWKPHYSIQKAIKNQI